MVTFRIEVTKDFYKQNKDTRSKESNNRVNAFLGDKAVEYGIIGWDLKEKDGKYWLIYVRNQVRDGDSNKK